MVLIIKIIKKIKKKFLEIINIFILRYYHVSYGENLVINGIISYTGTKGKVSIKNNVIINSGLQDIPIGYPVKVSFWILGNGEVMIGNNCGISNAAFCSMSSIKLGNHVLVGSGVKFYDTDFHSLNYLTRRDIENDNDRKSEEICVGDDVFIGAGSIILKGTTIGDRSIIGAGSVVCGKIPAEQVWAGNPAKFIRNLKRE